MFTNNNVLDAVYTSAENDTIAVIYRDEDAGQNQEMIIQVNENDVNYQSLVAAGWDHDKLTEATAEAKKEYMRGVYDMLRRDHAATHDQVLADLELEKQQAKERIQAEIDDIQQKMDDIQAAYDLKQEQFKLAVAAMDAVKKEYNLKTEE